MNLINERIRLVSFLTPAMAVNRQNKPSKVMISAISDETDKI